MSSSPVRFPVDLGGGLTPEPSTVELFRRHTEVDGTRGFFPLGGQSHWHGGVHLYADEGATVHAMLDGVVVAARLAPEAGDAVGTFGSHNFIVVRHDVRGRVLNELQEGDSLKRNETYSFFSIYMHLAPAPIEAGEDLHGFGWLAKDLEWSLDGSAGSGGANAKPDVELIQSLLVRAGIDPGPVDGLNGSKTMRGIRAFQKAHFDFQPDGRVDVGGQTWAELVFRATPDPATDGFDEDLIGALQAGDIVYPNRPICGGQPLWFVGPESDEAKAHLVHWEVISAQPLFADMQAVVDQSEFTGDTREVLQMLGGADWIGGDGFVHGAQIAAFYGDHEAYPQLREVMCSFRTEWAADPALMVAALESRFWVAELPEQIEPYLWYAEAAGEAALPEPSHWHYNPVTVVDRFAQRMRARDA
jgi:hypothetical protein